MSLAARLPIPGARPIAAALAAIAVAAAAAWLFQTGDRDAPQAVAGSPELQRLAERFPRDGRAFVMLGYRELEARRYAEAAAAFERAIAVSRQVAADPAVWCEYADALGMAQGSLAGKPTQAIEKALALQANHPKALEMAGSAAYERRDFRAAVRHWQTLHGLLAPGSTEHAQLGSAIARAQRLAATSLPPR